MHAGWSRRAGIKFGWPGLGL